MTTSRSKTYDQTCSECGRTYQGYRNRRIQSACGNRECLESELARVNAYNAKLNAEWTARPRTPRVRRQPVPLWGDLATIAAFNGISADGTGRSAR